MFCFCCAVVSRARVDRETGGLNRAELPGVTPFGRYGHAVVTWVTVGVQDLFAQESPILDPVTYFVSLTIASDPA